MKKPSKKVQPRVVTPVKASPGAHRATGAHQALDAATQAVVKPARQTYRPAR